MRSVNLLSFIQSCEALNHDLFQSYISYYCDEIIRSHEIDTLKKFLDLTTASDHSYQLFNNFYVGYKIPQIGKEMDLLKFDHSSVLNIELKSETNENKILEQLKKNRYYLRFLELSCTTITYTGDTNRLYILEAEQDELSIISFERLISILNGFSNDYNVHPDVLFDPSNYLVSPFNSTDEFMSGQYFLTQQQNQIKNIILKKLHQTIYFSVTGGPGTGKTLLTYDIAKDLIERGEDVLIIHCGKLNPGHHTLKEKYGWIIEPAKNLIEQLNQSWAFIIIDEIHRLKKHQFEHLLKHSSENSITVLFSYDSKQWLQKQEQNNDHNAVIQQIADNHNLSGKIRTNLEIASFILCLFNRAKDKPNYSISNVSFSYHISFDTAYQEVFLLNEDDNWTLINLTPDGVNAHNYHKYGMSHLNSHDVIGQEFDNVVCVVDHHMSYHGNELVNSGYQRQPFYHPVQMLFQNMTRVRKKLHIIIVANEEILERVLDILN